MVDVDFLVDGRKILEAVMDGLQTGVTLLYMNCLGPWDLGRRWGGCPGNQHNFSLGGSILGK